MNIGDGRDVVTSSSNPLHWPQQQQQQHIPMANFLQQQGPQHQQEQLLPEDISNWPMTGIAYPGKHDVMLGRGGESNYHTGNLTFRTFIQEHKKRYQKARKQEKPIIALEVVLAWRDLNPPGRFLARIDPSRADSLWEDVGDDQACKRAGRTLGEKSANKAAKLQQEQEKADEAKSSMTPTITADKALSGNSSSSSSSSSSSDRVKKKSKKKKKKRPKKPERDQGALNIIAAFVSGQHDPLDRGNDPLSAGSLADPLSNGQADPLSVGRSGPNTDGSRSDPLSVGNRSAPLQEGQRGPLSTSRVGSLPISRSDPLSIDQADPIATSPSDALSSRPDPFSVSPADLLNAVPGAPPASSVIESSTNAPLLHDILETVPCVPPAESEREPKRRRLSNGSDKCSIASDYIAELCSRSCQDGVPHTPPPPDLLDLETTAHPASLEEEGKQCRRPMAKRKNKHKKRPPPQYLTMGNPILQLGLDDKVLREYQTKRPPLQTPDIIEPVFDDQQRLQAQAISHQIPTAEFLTQTVFVDLL